jgi:predicted nucleic acid-binding protein
VRCGRPGPPPWSCSTAGPLDTNLLVSRFDPRFPERQQIADRTLRTGIAEGGLFLPHQAIVEFVAAVTRPIRGGPALLSAPDGRREAEELLAELEVLYPDEELVRIALRGAAAYQLPWFDAHLWAFAERFGLEELLSEDFEDGRLYGTVQVRNPFRSRFDG